jgi:hypothetical protein
VSDSKKPGPTLHLKACLVKHTPAARKPTQEPQVPRAPPKPPRVKGPAYTPPRRSAAFMARFWMVMRSAGRRPKVRLVTLDEARTEAQRIAERCPGSHVWVIECTTVETVTRGAEEGSSQA